VTGTMAFSPFLYCTRTSETSLYDLGEA